jgi:hypothetical protein
MTIQNPEPSRVGSHADIPPDADSAADRVAAIGMVLLGVTSGVQAMLAVLLVFGPKTVPGLAGTLTDWGRSWCRPERESLIYVAGCAATVLLVLGLDWVRRSRRRLAPPEAGRDALACGLVQAALAAVSTLAFFAVIEFERPLAYRDGGPALALAMLMIPVALPLLAGLVAVARGPGRLARGLADAVSVLMRPDRQDWPNSGVSAAGVESRRPRRLVGLGADLAVAGLIVAIVYIPDWGRAAGKIAFTERPSFFHWDFFAMAPALGFIHGRALCTDVFSQYGVAWPVLFASLDPIVPLSYGHLIGFSVIYTSFYFVGLYWLLCLVFGSRNWAALGVFAGLARQLFLGGLWCFPSATILRMPTDVWFFLALLFYLRSGKGVWCWLASGLTGAAVLFEIDTGIYQAAVLTFFWSCLLARESHGGDVAAAAPIGRWAALSAAIVAVTVLAGLAVASRGTLIRPGFWRDWLEGLIVFGGSGMSALPFEVGQGVASIIVIFFTIVASLLAVVAWLIVRLRKGEASDPEIFRGCYAAYGLAGLLLFVHRTQWTNLFPPSIPISVLAVAALKWTAEAVSSRLANRSAAGPLASLGTTALFIAPYALLGLVGVDLFRNPHFHEYPNLINRSWQGAPKGGLCLMSGVCGLPPESEEPIREFRAVVARMAALRAEGRTVAILVPADTMYYLASGCPPRDRYTPLLTNLMTKQQVRQAKARFVESNNDYVLIKIYESSENDWYEVLAKFRALIGRDYIVEGKIGTFELWRRATSGVRSGSS